MAQADENLVLSILEPLFPMLNLIIILSTCFSKTKTLFQHVVFSTTLTWEAMQHENVVAKTSALV